MFRTLRSSQRTLDSVDIQSLRPVPVEEPDVLDALLRVWENMAFFGDLILRLPDQVHTLLDGHTVRLGLVRWGIELCMSSPIYEEIHREQLELVLQETGLAEQQDPNYINPFSEAYIQEQQRKKLEEQNRQEQYMKKVLRKQRMRNRKLQRTEL